MGVRAVDDRAPEGLERQVEAHDCGGRRAVHAERLLADVIGLDSEEVEIPGAVKVERLLVPFWENGQHSAIPSILKQKVFVEEQRKRFVDLDNYRVKLSERLRRLRDELVTRMKTDNSGWQEILKRP